MRLLKTFGTHYITNVIMGGKKIHRFEFSRKQTEVCEPWPL